MRNKECMEKRAKRLKNVKAVFCRVCNQKYLKSSKPTPGRKANIGIRGFNTINCSPKCSKEYADKFWRKQK